MKHNKKLVTAVAVMTVVLAILVAAALFLPGREEDPKPTTLQTQPTADTDPTQQQTDPPTDPPTEPPTEPPVTKMPRRPFLPLAIC